MQFISVFLDITKVADFWGKNTNVGKTQGVCHMIYIFFRSSLVKVGGHFAPSISGAAPKSPFLNTVKLLKK